MAQKTPYVIKRVSGMPVSNDELLADLRRIALSTGKNTVGEIEYKTSGKYNERTVSRRFGSWNKALLAAGLSISNEVNISDVRLFENLLNLWQHYGRQPRRAELAKPPSTISQGPYKRRFHSWVEALNSFVEYANATDNDTPLPDSANNLTKPRDTGRDPSLRLRWKVLQRDRFKCCACGASPAITPGVELHVDHIKAWSKGGETLAENLQTLCSTCNLGKSNE
jgi:hypothetical protein